MDEGAEKELSEAISLQMVEDRRKEPDPIQLGEFQIKLEEDGVAEKLRQYEGFVGKYAKNTGTQELRVDLVDGPAGNGEVRDGKLTVNLPSRDEIDRSSLVTADTEQNMDILNRVGISYKELVFALASSTVLHESAHMILDSRPGSELEKDFTEFTGIENDRYGVTLTLLDEGVTYAFQMVSDSENDLFKKLEGIGPQPDEDFLVSTRKQLGEALRSKVKGYLDRNQPIDKEFLEFAGVEMKKLDIERYIKETNERK